MVSVAEHLRRKRSLEGSGPFDPFSLPSLKQLAEPIDARPDEVLATVYDCRCFDCGATYSIALDSLAEFGAPDCSCGAGALRSDALETMADESRESDGPKLIRERWVDIRVTHYCDTCHGDLYAGDRALNRVESEQGELRSIYLGMCCWGGTAAGQGSNPNGTKFYDETRSEFLPVTAGGRV